MKPSRNPGKFIVFLSLIPGQHFINSMGLPIDHQDLTASLPPFLGHPI